MARSTSFRSEHPMRRGPFIVRFNDRQSPLRGSCHAEARECGRRSWAARGYLGIDETISRYSRLSVFRRHRIVRHHRESGVASASERRLSDPLRRRRRSPPEADAGTGCAGAVDQPRDNSGADVCRDYSSPGLDVTGAARLVGGRKDRRVLLPATSSAAERLGEHPMADVQRNVDHFSAFCASDAS